MTFFREQRELIIESYTALRDLRLLFANHPKGGSVEISEAVRDGKIWIY